jgi:type II secretory pathway pseudopilin PulG
VVDEKLMGEDQNKMRSEQCSGGVRLGSRSGFTLLDLLVSLAVIAILVSLMLPALSKVRETTRQVVCASNVRQLSLGMAMYADDYRSQLPYSISYTKSLFDPTFDPLLLQTVRVSGDWDGLGQTFPQYLPAPGVFYCPSHQGGHTLANFQSAWNGQTTRDIRTNFQFRGGNGRGVTRLDAFMESVALISDGLASPIDFNHSTGANVAMSDLSVNWANDRGGAISGLISSTTLSDKDQVLQAWEVLEAAVLGGSRSGNGGQ